MMSVSFLPFSSPRLIKQGHSQLLLKSEILPKVEISRHGGGGVGRCLSTVLGGHKATVRLLSGNWLESLVRS